MRNLLFAAVIISVALTFMPSEVRPEAAGESSFRVFLPQWEAAQTRFINGDPTLWKQNASHGDYATVFGAFGGYEKGWKEVGPRYDWASSQFKESGATQKIEYISIEVSGDLAFTVGIERQLAQLAGEDKLSSRALRVTQVFQREGGVWRLLHRHADALTQRQPPSEAH